MRTLWTSCAATFLFALSLAALGGPIQGSGGDKRKVELEPTPSEKEKGPAAPLETMGRAASEKSVADGLYMSGVFTYSFSGSTASITLDRINNDANNTTGTLQLSLWALDYEPVRGAGITGYRLATFSTFNPFWSSLTRCSRG